MTHLPSLQIFLGWKNIIVMYEFLVKYCCTVIPNNIRVNILNPGGNQGDRVIFYLDFEKSLKKDPFPNYHLELLDNQTELHPGSLTDTSSI